LVEDGAGVNDADIGGVGDILVGEGDVVEVDGTKDVEAGISNLF
jgi:hypothetical protein